MQEGKQNAGLKLVSRKQRLALAPGPFRPSGPGVWALQHSPLTAAVQASESNVWQYGLLASGPFRPSGPRCLGPATRPFDRSCAGGKPALRTSKQVGSWQCRKASRMQVFQLVSSQCRKQRLADFGSMGCLLRAGSVLQGQGVWALRHDPLTAASFRARMFRPCDGPFTTASFRPFKSIGIYNQSMTFHDSTSIGLPRSSLTG